MVKLREPTKSDAIQTVIVVMIFIVAMAIILFLSMPDNLPAGLLLVAGCLYFLVRWHAKTFGYRCANCGTDFEITTWKDFRSFQGMNKQGSWKYLRCPHCGKWTKARELTKTR